VPRMIVLALMMALAAMPSFSPSLSTAPMVTIDTIGAPLAREMVTSAFTAPLAMEEMVPLKMLRALMFMVLLLLGIDGDDEVKAAWRILRL